jgi:hypothetical protein
MREVSGWYVLCVTEGQKGTPIMLTETQMLVLVVVLALAAVAVLIVMSKRAARQKLVRHDQLKGRFGPEYDRAIEQHGSVDKAERELAAREKRIQQLRLHAIPDEERARFSAEWRNVQARFVDDPSGAVTQADDLIKSVMIARGYSNERFEQRVADLSVEHAGVVQHYRAAHGLAEANREGKADTEELRQAFVHYRALFADLLEQPQQPTQQNLQEAHP